MRGVLDSLKGIGRGIILGIPLILAYDKFSQTSNQGETDILVEQKGANATGKFAEQLSSIFIDLISVNEGGKLIGENPEIKKTTLEIWLERNVSLKNQWLSPKTVRVEQAATDNHDLEKISFDCYSKNGEQGYNLCISSKEDEVNFLLQGMPGLPGIIPEYEGEIFEAFLIRCKKAKDGTITNIKVYPLISKKKEKVYAKPLPAFEVTSAQLHDSLNSLITKLDKALKDQEEIEDKREKNEKAETEGHAKEIASSQQFAMDLLNATVTINTYTHNLKGRSGCSGSKVFKDAILTARHCVSQDQRSPGFLLEVDNLRPGNRKFFVDPPSKIWDESTSKNNYFITIHPYKDIALIAFSSPLFTDQKDVILEVTENEPPTDDTRLIGRLNHNRWQIQAGSFVSTESSDTANWYNFGVEPGDSGSPLLNINREITGILRATKTPNPNLDLTFSLSPNVTKREVNELYEKAKKGLMR